MLKLGLLGKGISHSRSQEMYEKLLGEKVDYHLLDYSSEESIPMITELFKQGFKGLSITFPYKRTFLDQVEIDSDPIKELNAINCMGVFDGKIKATNTDYLAAEFLLKDFSNHEFVILGNGNMARIFKKLMLLEGKTFSHFFRSEKGDLNSLDYHSLKKGKDLVVINCCSRQFQFDAKLPSGSTFWDMNYSFPEHDHLKEKVDLTYREGLDLLLEQARFALEFWKIRTL